MRDIQRQTDRGRENERQTDRYSDLAVPYGNSSEIVSEDDGRTIV